MSVEGFQVVAGNAAAPFTLKLHRGDGMVLLAMDWRKGRPPRDFVGFAIEYREPGGDRFWPVRNRINFPKPDGSVDPERKSSLVAPIQKFRWVHFPMNAELDGPFTYRVSPVFMESSGELRLGEAQEADIVLARETCPGSLNVCFTRGFVSSQAFVDRYVTETDGMATLIPATADEGLDFLPTHPKAEAALEWMGFEARRAILEVLDEALADQSATVRVVCYDLNDPSIVERLERLGTRLRIIVDDSAEHEPPTSAESQAAERLRGTAGQDHVKRQHMSNLQHNKTIVVEGGAVDVAVCGSTNFTWRGQFVQSNNALVLRGRDAVRPFAEAFEDYWKNDSVKGFGPTESTAWRDLGIEGVDASVTFSPHSKRRKGDDGKTLLEEVADDIRSARSSVFYSLAFLSQTGGAVTEAIEEVTEKEGIFVYGISDKRAGGLDVRLPDGKIAPVYAANLARDLPEPFRSEPSGLNAKGSGTRMHHKFVVIDFDKPTARVYTGSFNFSVPADNQNGENLVLVRDRRVAVSYMIQALSLFDHYHFRVRHATGKGRLGKLQLATPPAPGQSPWWEENWTDPRKILDRKLFA